MKRLFLSAILFLSSSAALPAGEELILLVPGLERGEKTAAPAEILRPLGAALDLVKARQVPAPPGDLDAASLSAADAVLLDERSLEALDRWSDASVHALREAVRGGKGLVVAGRAAGALAGSEEFSILLGRKVPPAPPHPFPEGEELLAAILDQSHPVTQCVTHLLFAGGSLSPEPGEGVAPLAALLPRRALPDAKGAVALWARDEGRGHLVVWAFAPGPHPSKGEGEAVALLLARAVEWAAGRSVTVRIPDGLPLLAERLRSPEAGLAALVGPAGGFYRGRQIAPVMSFHGASWLERAEREKTELPEKVLDALGIEEGSTVADLGAGTGYFSLRMARRVGPRGRVLAVEVQEEMLRLLGERMEKDEVHNVEPILATELDPRLPQGRVELALLVDVYHELTHPGEVLAGVRKGLAAGGKGKRPGRLVLVEYRGEDPAVPIKPLHRMTERQARSEVEPAGFRWLETKEFLPHQHILIFERGGEGGEGSPIQEKG